MRKKNRFWIPYMSLKFINVKQINYNSCQTFKLFIIKINKMIIYDDLWLINTIKIFYIIGIYFIFS